MGPSRLMPVVLIILSIARLAGAEQPESNASAEELGMSSKALRTLVERVQGWVDDDEVVGAEILILKNRRVVLHEAVGLMDLDETRPLKRNTIACVRSMTKPVVGTAIQMLVDEGKLGLDDRVGKHLASFAKGKSSEITVRQMLTHTGGFPLTLMNRPLSAYAGHQAVVDQIASAGPTAKPGERFAYSDCDTEVLAALVSEVSGTPVDEFIQKRILTPLGMSDTHCVLGKAAPERSRVSSNHAGATGLWHRYWGNTDPPLFPFFLGAAALYSTPRDYAKFVTVWADRGKSGASRLISNDAVERALVPAIPMLAPSFDMKLKIPMPTGLHGAEVFYGQHWMIYHTKQSPQAGVLPIFGHGGSDGTGAWVFPAHDMMAFYFSQSRNGLTVIRFEELLAPLVGLPAAPSAFGGDRLPTDALKAYVGAYRNPKAGSVVYVARWGRRLGIELMGSGCSILRWPDSTGKWGLESPGTGVRFTKAADGTVTRLTVSEGSVERSFERVRNDAAWPTVDRLMRDRRQAQGAEHIDALKTLSMEGSLDVGAAKKIGQTKFLVEGPRRLLRTVTINQKPAESTVVNGPRAWKSTGGQPFEEVKGLLYEQSMLANPLLRLADWRDAYDVVEVVGKGRVGDDDVWLVWTKRSHHPSSTKHVSARTGLLLKEDSWITVKGVGTIPLSIEYGDYRDVAGVKLPFRIVSESAMTSRQLGQFTQAVANPNVRADAFAIPQRD